MINEESNYGDLLPDTFIDSSGGSYGGTVDDYQASFQDYDLRGPNVQFLQQNGIEEEEETLGLDAFVIELFDGSIEIFSTTEIVRYIDEWKEQNEDEEKYDGNMSIECSVEYSYKDSGFTLNTDDYKPFDATGDSQTLARIPIYVEGRLVSFGGYFRECFTSINYGIEGQVNAQPVLSFVRIS